MSVNVVVPMDLPARQREVCHRLLKEYNVDITTLLICALEHWFELAEMDPLAVIDVLRPTLDRLLHGRGQRLTFEQYTRELVDFRDALYRLYNGVEAILNPLLEANGADALKLSLRTQLSNGTPVVHIKPR